MKKLLMAMTALLIFAACEQKADETKTTEDVTEVQDNAGQSFQDLLIPEDEGNTMIQRYHDYLINDMGVPRENLHEKHLSFILNANALRSVLNSHQNYTDMVMYLAMDEQNKLTLVYVGAERDSMNIIVEQPIVDEENNNYVMDHVIPCPTCDRSNKIHNPASGE